MEPKYLIWSIDHGGWWKPNRRGYTKNRSSAGLYSMQEAKAICEVNHGTPDDSEPGETIVPFYE
jgi:hypothetical protein